MNSNGQKGKNTKTILLVEDEPGNREILSEVLMSLGYTVIGQPDGYAALDVVQQGFTPDLAIIDYRLPGMNGLDLILALRRMLATVPVIMMTAYGDVENYFRSLNLGVFDFVEKPFAKREFEKVVRAALDDADAA